MRLLLLPLLIFFIGCSSSHLEQGSLAEEEYLSKINKELNNEDVIVNYTDSKSEEGVFIRVDSKFLLIKQHNTIKEISINRVRSIEYQNGSVLAGSIVGGIVGFFAGALIVKASGATINFGGGSKNPEFILAIPFTTLAGTIWGGVQGNSYKTIKLEIDSTTSSAKIR